MSTKNKWSNKINKLGDQIVKWRIKKGFTTPSSFKTEKERDYMLAKLMLVVTEVAEASEAVRHNDMENFKEEIADALIRLLDIGRTMKLDLEKDIANKMDVNYTRPKKHGKHCSV